MLHRMTTLLSAVVVAFVAANALNAVSPAIAQAVALAQPIVNGEATGKLEVRPECGRVIDKQLDRFIRQGRLRRNNELVVGHGKRHHRPHHFAGDAQWLTTGHDDADLRASA